MQKDVQLHSGLDSWKALWTALGFSTYLQSNIKAMTDARKGIQILCSSMCMYCLSLQNVAPICKVCSFLKSKRVLYFCYPKQRQKGILSVRCPFIPVSIAVQVWRAGCIPASISVDGLPWRSPAPAVGEAERLRKNLQEHCLSTSQDLVGQNDCLALNIRDFYLELQQDYFCA